MPNASSAPWGGSVTGDNLAMSTVIHKASPFQRLMPLLKGFDGPLAFGVFLLACAGMLTMYSSGFANGARFFDHGRNMLLAGFIMFVVAQIPPQRLMAFAVPLYTPRCGLVDRRRFVWVDQERRTPLAQCGHGDSAQ